MAVSHSSKLPVFRFRPLGKQLIDKEDLHRPNAQVCNASIILQSSGMVLIEIKVGNVRYPE